MRLGDWGPAHRPRNASDRFFARLPARKKTFVSRGRNCGYPGPLNSSCNPPLRLDGCDSLFRWEHVHLRLRPAVWAEYHSKRSVGAQERWTVGWYPERYVRAIPAACGGANSFVVTDGHFLRTARAN